MIALPPVRVLLVGMMGAGKTTVGRALSERTGWPYLDNDDLVERATGRTAQQLLGAGPAQLRHAESAAISVVLQMPPPLVASVPGGGVETAADRNRLRSGGFIVWLRASMQTLAERLRTDTYRPWLYPDPEQALRRLYAGREAKYAEIAHLVLDVDRASPRLLADSIVSALTTPAVDRDVHGCCD